jgi:predicted nucleic acid-binding Zn ribbon protein
MGCIIEGCDRNPVARGLCNRHYYAAKRRGDLDIVAPRPTQCEWCCGPLGDHRTFAARFCSQSCKEAARAAAKTAQIASRRAGRICVECAAPIPLTASGKALTCSRQCGVRYQNRRKQEARESGRGVRPNCGSCGRQIPNDRRWGTIFCSFECKQREHSRRSRERSPHYMRRYLYGITREQYEALLEAQENGCAICRSTEWVGKANSPHVDHDHATGAIRGLLCGPCNTGLGNYRDNPSLLRAAANYLEAHSTS